MSVSEYNTVVPDNINRIISEKGLKHGAVAAWAGFSKQQFSDMLNGRKVIKCNDAIAIAGALNVGIDDLFFAGARDTPSA